MSHDINHNKQLVAKYLEALSGRPKTADIIARFVSDPSLIEHIKQVESGFPCYELTANEILAERDMVTVRGVFRGVHRGPFVGLNPTGKDVTANLIIIYRIEDDRIAEHWLQFDLLSLIEQIKTEAVAAR